jgi:hypothetical protein
MGATPEKRVNHNVRSLTPKTGDEQGTAGQTGASQSAVETRVLLDSAPLWLLGGDLTGTFAHIDPTFEALNFCSHFASCLSDILKNEHPQISQSNVAVY